MSIDVQQPRRLDPVRGAPSFDAHGNWRSPLPHEIATDATFTLAAIADADADAARTLCTLGDTHIADCDVDTRPRRTWWRRADAE